MNKYFMQTFGIFCLLLVTITCNVKRGNTSNQKAIMNDTVTFVGCREEITLEVGSVAEIQLEAVQGTGYQWLMKDPSLLLEQLWSDVLKYSTGGKENMPGQAGFQVLYFRAVQKGKGEVRLEYKKTFEPTIEKSCVIKVEVK